MSSISYPIGVLAMAYGGPSSLAEIPGYLADIRSGRPTPKAVVDAISANYRKIGGRSPLLEISRRQVELVARCLDSAKFRVYLGMRHWAPWIEEVVGSMVEDGITHAVSIVLAPHHSALSVGRYQAKIAEGLKLYGGSITFEHIDSYHAEPWLIETFVRRVHEGLERWPKEERPSVHVVFTAHSLPARVLETGDRYDLQVAETAQLVASRAALSTERWSRCYQSAGRTAEPWLGPQIDDHVVSLAARGVKNVLCMPIGFVSDHVEILHDIDVRARATAEARGVRLERPPALNDDPLFIELLADLVRRRAGKAQWLRDDRT